MMTVYLVAYCYAAVAFNNCVPVHMSPQYTISREACEQQLHKLAMPNLQCLEAQVPAWQPVGQ